MRLFAEVVRNGSYTKAADSLGVSKGYLSKQIRFLEQELGKSLLVRNTRMMRLTSAGETLYQEAIKLTNFWQQTKSLLDASEEELAGKVKCTAPMGIARYVLWPLFNALMTKQPELNVTIDSGNTTHNLIADDFDFAVRLTNTPPEDMIARKLVKVNYICCATPDFIAKFGAPSSPLALPDKQCVVLPHWNEWHFTVSGKLERVKPNGRFIASDNDLLKEACLASLGIARLPDYMVSKEIVCGELVNLFQSVQGDSRDLYLIYPQLSARPKRVAMCLSAIEQAFKAQH